MIKYFRHFPLAFWAFLSLFIGVVLIYAQNYDVEKLPNRSLSAQPSDEHANAMSLIMHLSTVHAAAAPPASGLSIWGTNTAAIAQGYADRRALLIDDGITQAYLDVAAAAMSITTLDFSNREQILAGMAAIGAAGIRLGAEVNGLSVPGVGNQNMNKSISMKPNVESQSHNLNSKVTQESILSLRKNYKYDWTQKNE